MSNVLRIQLKLLSNYCNKYNKSSNICFYCFRICCLDSKLNKLNRICIKSNSIAIRHFSSIGSDSKNNSKQKSSKRNELISESETDSQTGLTIGQRVKQTTQDISYFGIIIAGIGVTALILYAIFRELFSSSSPSVIYSKALKLCKSDPRVVEAVGRPLKGFGEMTSRGRRRHVSSLEYERAGQQVIRIQFYLKGSKSRATVHLEAFKSGSKPHFRYLFVQLDDSQNVIILEDNRHID